MDMFANLIMGFDVALSLQNLMYCFIGVFVGTAIGVLPGIGRSSPVAMLLPITFNLPPVPALIMLAGPQVMTSKPDLFWGLIASMWIGNALLVILNLPLVGYG